MLNNEKCKICGRECVKHTFTQILVLSLIQGGMDFHYPATSALSAFPVGTNLIVEGAVWPETNSIYRKITFCNRFRCFALEGFC